MAAAQFEVEYHGMDVEYLLNYKTLHFDVGQVNTPFVAQEVGRWTNKNQPLEAARGFNEVYLSISPNYLSNETRDLRAEIEATLEPWGYDEPTVVFFEITSERSVDDELLSTLVDIQIEYSHFLATPFRPDTADAINSRERNVDQSEYFERYESTLSNYLDIVDQRPTSKPVLGGVPVISRERTRELVLSYLKREIASICVDFNGRSPLVSTQIDAVIVPLQTELGLRDWHEDGFLYAINADRGQYTQAAGFLALAVGFDALGGYHTSPRGDEEYFEWLNEHEKTTFRTFRKADFIHREIPIEEIVDKFPPRTNLDAAHVQELAENGSANEARKVLNAEQKALAANDLRQAINYGNSTDLLRSKPCVDGRVHSNLKQVRDAHDTDSVQGQLPMDD